MIQDYRRHEPQEIELKNARFGAALEMIGRVASTTVIWFMATGMLAVSSDMIRRGDGSIFPVLILGGAVLSTAVVWLGGYKRERRAAAQRQSAAELAATQKRLHELEQRLSNLETINGFERRLAEETAARQLSVPQSGPEWESARTQGSF